jgi:hypothetical protein
MPHRIADVAILLLVSTAAAAQQPTPLFNPSSPGPSSPGPTNPGAPADQPAPAAPPTEPMPGRIFCGQSVSYHIADPDSLPATYRPFVGIWSDAAWTPQLCAALIVESITSDGTATITYAFGPIGSGGSKPRGVLHGTGIIEDGELKFQNADGSQYGFKPFYSDLSGHWTTPKGETYETIFKKTF